MREKYRSSPGRTALTGASAARSSLRSEKTVGKQRTDSDWLKCMIRRLFRIEIKERTAQYVRLSRVALLHDEFFFIKRFLITCVNQLFGMCLLGKFDGVKS